MTKKPPTVPYELTGLLTPLDLRLKQLAAEAKEKLAKFPSGMTVLYDKEEKKTIRVFHVDAREIMKLSGDRYSTEIPPAEMASSPESPAQPETIPVPAEDVLTVPVGDKKSRK